VNIIPFSTADLLHNTKSCYSLRTLIRTVKMECTYGGTVFGCKANSHCNAFVFV